MFNLAAVDWLIVLLYVIVVLGVGLALRPFIKSSSDFLLAGRALPAWLCALAFAGINLGAPEVLGMGAWGARYGLSAAQFYLLGALPAMLCAGLFFMPLYYGSGARSGPEFLGLRFDAKTRVLNAVLFALMAVFTAGILLCALGRLAQALHIFDVLFVAFGLPLHNVFLFTVALSALVVLAYVLLSGLTGVLYNQALQFLLLVAGLLPAVLLGLHSIGGWTGLKASVHAGHMHLWNGPNPTGMGVAGLAIGLGLVLGAGFWCTDTRVLQAALAAKDADSARRVPLLAALLRLFLPLVLILPGLLAIGLPTPHSTTIVRDQNGSIYHEITIVPLAVQQGHGLVPARTEPATGKPILDASGHSLLNYGMATPQVLHHFLPSGLLGLALAALLASFMSGIAGNVAAFNTVFTRDLYQACLRKHASDHSLLIVGRLAAVACLLLAVAVALVAANVGGILAALLLAFSVVNAPVLAAFLLGVFWPRATGHGAFAGLLAGIAAAVLHHGLTLPAGAAPGLCGGWIAVLHRYPGSLAQNLTGAIVAFAASLLVAALVSVLTPPRPAAQLAGLVYSLTPRRKRKKNPWWKRPESLAAAIVLLAVILNLIFA